MKKIMLAFLGSLLMISCTACGGESGYLYYSEAEMPQRETEAETTEAPTELPTLSDEQISDMISATEPPETSVLPDTTEQNPEETDASALNTEQNTDTGLQQTTDFGAAVYQSKRDDESERFFFFYGNGSGSYLEQETGTGMGFTYVMASEDTAIFHFGDTQDIASLYWISPSEIEIFWESGGFETLTKLPNDPKAGLRFYSSELLRTRALQTYERKTGFKATNANSFINYDGMISIQLYDDVGNHFSTVDWYTVDRYTGIGTNLLGETIDLSDAGMSGAPPATDPAATQPVSEMLSPESLQTQPDTTMAAMPLP